MGIPLWRQIHPTRYTETTIFTFPFTLNGYDRGDSFPFEFFKQMDFHLVQNRKENLRHDHIPFNVKGNMNIVFSVYRPTFTRYSPYIYPIQVQIYQIWDQHLPDICLIFAQNLPNIWPRLNRIYLFFTLSLRTLLHLSQWIW